MKGVKNFLKSKWRSTDSAWKYAYLFPIVIAFVYVEWFIDDAKFRERLSKEKNK